MDCILMSIDRSQYEAQVQASQDAATSLESRIIKKRGVKDELRNINPHEDWMEIRDQTDSEEESELAI
jgi:hypothetical protein